ncbi:MAG TPA: LysM peptidoglycan-binding domain-containing protein [Thermoanaerobaculia bacterium]|nr:LysM peptidoglycan-binding domain-containing protein [Thermoanaerobaculia bacterium]
MALPLYAQKQSSRPPKNLHKVGDHWTAYNPPDPATYPANARTHTIVSGDTLWDLAQTYYGNAYLWPQLWESNTWITDAHWIYPGDVLLIEGEASGASVATDTTTTTTETETTAETQTDPSTIIAAEIKREATPIPLGTEADVYCYGYIGHPEEPMPNFVAGFEDVEVMYQPGLLTSQEAGATAGDLVFVTGGTSTGLVAGETYMVVEPAETVIHPRSKEVIGRQYNYQGQLRILCAEETTARAVITQSCREVKLGTRLKPVPQLPIPIARVPDMPAFCDVPSGRSTGFIVESQDWELGLGEGNLVQVNLGRDDQLQPGDFLVVYRDSPIAGQPRQILGEIGILTTESRTATGKIVAMRRVMQIGDYVERR